MTFVCLATFYVMLHAPFMAAIQIMVYAGAIIVIIVFVIMLLNLGTETKRKVNHGVIASLVLAVLVFLQVVFFLNRSEPVTMKGDVTTEVVRTVGHTELIGEVMFTEFLLPFEIASILLLVAMVGAVVLTKRRV
jgi:NADH-quinone oxidoreductase subunit J